MELLILGQSGTVCDDFWSSKDAEVACRQLGYSTDGKSCMKLWYGHSVSVVIISPIQEPQHKRWHFLVKALEIYSWIMLSVLAQNLHFFSAPIQLTTTVTILQMVVSCVSHVSL